MECLRLVCLKEVGYSQLPIYYRIYHFMSIKLTYRQLSYSFSPKQIPDYSVLLQTAQKIFVGGAELEQRLHYIFKDEAININSQQTFLKALALFPEQLEVHVTRPQAILEAPNEKDRLTIPEIVGKYKPKGPVVSQPNWDEGEWLDFITKRIDRGKQEDLRREVKLNTRVSKSSSMNFEAKELEDDVLREIEGCAAKAERVTHSEDGAGSFLLSLYDIESRRQNIPVEDCCKKLWKLDAWRSTKRQDKSTKKINKLNLTKKQESFIPFLYAANAVNLDNEQETISYLFSNPPVKPDVKPKQQRSKIEYYLMDKLYHLVLVIHQMEKGDKVTLEQIKNVISIFREYSDWDYQFVIKVIESYAEYSEGGDIYKAPTSDRSGLLPEFDDKEIVGIVGDWGTGYRDANDLLDELVLKQNATIVIHLGDVYYAGFPEEFKRISDKINALQKIRPKFRYYTVPGNHDYYTFGGPFQQHLSMNHLDKNMNQRFSFFCLRNRSHTVQFLGVDTGVNEHSFITPLNPFFEGAVMETPEVRWAIARVKEFPGRTIMISHHPLFSVFEATLGKTTDFSWQDPQISFHLAEDLFEILPKITCWFWGHEHRFAVHRENAYGVNKCILLGNGSFQNNQENYYSPLYNQGDLVRREFFPEKDDRGYYHHTAAVMTNFNSYEIGLKYVYMTSSYTEPSEKVREEFDSVSQPTPQPIELGTNYHILEQSGLSICTLKGQVWLHYSPTSIQFKRADLPSEDGELRTGVDFLMQVGDSRRYLYYSSWGFIELGDYDSESSSEKEKYRWRIEVSNPQKIQKTVMTGDSFQLTSVYRKAKMGREFHLNYFRLSFADEPSKFQIYRHVGEEQTVKLFSQQQEEPKMPATGRCAQCCELM